MKNRNALPLIGLFSIAFAGLSGCFSSPEPVVEKEITILESLPFYQDGLEEGTVILNGWYMRHRDPNKSWVILIPGKGESAQGGSGGSGGAVEPEFVDPLEEREETIADLATSGPGSMHVIDGETGKISMDGKTYVIESGRTYLYDSEGMLIPVDIKADLVINWNAYLTGLRRVQGSGVTVDPGVVWTEYLRRPVMALVK